MWEKLKRKGIDPGVGNSKGFKSSYCSFVEGYKGKYTGKNEKIENVYKAITIIIMNQTEILELKHKYLK